MYLTGMANLEFTRSSLRTGAARTLVCDFSRVIFQSDPALSSGFQVQKWTQSSLDSDMPTNAQN